MSLVATCLDVINKSATMEKYVRQSKCAHQIMLFHICQMFK